MFGLFQSHGRSRRNNRRDAPEREPGSHRASFFVYRQVYWLVIQEKIYFSFYILPIVCVRSLYCILGIPSLPKEKGIPIMHSLKAFINNKKKRFLKVRGASPVPKNSFRLIS